MAYESLIGSWSDEDFYDKRKKYMLDRVNEAFSDRSVKSKLGSSLVERTGQSDADTLRDDKPKSGQAVSLLRDTSTVSDQLLQAIEKVANTDSVLIHKSPDDPDYDQSLTQNWMNQQAESKGLRSIQSLLGRKDNAPSGYTSETQLVIDPDSDFGRMKEVITQIPNFNLTDADKEKLKKMGTQALLDKYFEVDTSKY